MTARRCSISWRPIRATSCSRSARRNSTAIAIGILHLQERQRIALFVRRDPFERFVSCLVYVPRDRFNTDFRLRIQEILARAYKGRFSSVYTHMTDAPLVRLQFIIATMPGTIPDVDPDEVERQIVEAGRSWADQLQDALVEARGEENGLTLHAPLWRSLPRRLSRTLHADAGDPGHRACARSRCRAAASAINLYRPIEAKPSELRLKLYNAGTQIALSDVLPILENMGLKVMTEEPFRGEAAGQREIGLDPRFQRRTRPMGATAS